LSFHGLFRLLFFRTGPHVFEPVLLLKNSWFLNQVLLESPKASVPNPMTSW
jgi:hypothetical protein